MRCKIDERIYQYFILILKTSNPTRKKKGKGKPGGKPFTGAPAASETPSENSADQGTKKLVYFYLLMSFFKTYKEPIDGSAVSARPNKNNQESINSGGEIADGGVTENAPNALSNSKARPIDVGTQTVAGMGPTQGSDPLKIGTAIAPNQGVSYAQTGTGIALNQGPANGIAPNQGGASTQSGAGMTSNQGAAPTGTGLLAIDATKNSQNSIGNSILTTTLDSKNSATISSNSTATTSSLKSANISTNMSDNTSATTNSSPTTVMNYKSY